ncbi:hypothetical protein ZHAS_00003866 [Anopheles sinensis]|uniref:Uncharacterized protein n=1 Tax=Anopheles sinensis TaxID=74873 RepID=A0A084VFE6_ANOSI|nr:hypothetical protein ZHAS_00003866 [Anopheles sinensis]
MYPPGWWVCLLVPVPAPSWDAMNRSPNRMAEVNRETVAKPEVAGGLCHQKGEEVTFRDFYCVEAASLNGGDDDDDDGEVAAVE